MPTNRRTASENGVQVRNGIFLAVKVSTVMKLARKWMELGTSLSEVIVSERQSPRVLSYICGLAPIVHNMRYVRMSVRRDKKPAKQDRQWTLL